MQHGVWQREAKENGGKQRYWETQGVPTELRILKKS